MARKYQEVTLPGPIHPDAQNGIIDIHVSTGYGGPVHLVVSADRQELVDILSNEMVKLLAQHLVTEEE